MRYTLLATAACGLVVGLVPLRNVVVAGQFALVATNGLATMDLAHPLTERVNLEGAERLPLYRALDLDQSVIRYAEFLRQDPLGFRRGQHVLGQAVVEPRQLQFRRRVVQDMVLAREPPEEHLQRAQVRVLGLERERLAVRAPVVEQVPLVALEHGLAHFDRSCDPALGAPKNEDPHVAVAKHDGALAVATNS